MRLVFGKPDARMTLRLPDGPLRPGRDFPGEPPEQVRAFEAGRIPDGML